MHNSKQMIDSKLFPFIDDLLKLGINRPSNIQFCIQQNPQLEQFDTPTVKQISNFIRAKNKNQNLQKKQLIFV